MYTDKVIDPQLKMTGQERCFSCFTFHLCPILDVFRYGQFGSSNDYVCLMFNAQHIDAIKSKEESIKIDSNLLITMFQMCQYRQSCLSCELKIDVRQMNIFSFTDLVHRFRFFFVHTCLDVLFD